MSSLAEKNKKYPAIVGARVSGDLVTAVMSDGSDE
jgi:hypothetical protein